jgi:hypothetical protein
LSVQGEKCQGATAIVGKLTSLSFNKVQHNPKTMTVDVHPGGNNSLIVFVTGELILEGEEMPLRFSQVFHLIAEGTNFYVQNDILRI